MDSEKIKFTEEFIRTCGFIHDDYEPCEIDHYGSNPFLIGAEVCVIDSLDAFGEKYLSYLAGINILPKVIVVPTHRNDSLLDNLLKDKESLDIFCSELVLRKLDISVFYSDKNFSELVSYLENRYGYSPQIYPSKKQYCLSNNRIAMRKLLLKNDLPIPEGKICLNLSDLSSYHGRFKGKNVNLVVKCGHRKATVINSEKKIHRYYSSIDYPVIVEILYDTISSPVSNYIQWGGKRFHLFTIDQIITDLKHAGNRAPILCSKDQLNIIYQLSETVLDNLDLYEGIIGIDFIITKENEILIVDINGRFNSCTYPFYYLLKLNRSMNGFFAIYRNVDVVVQDLSEIYEQQDFNSFCPKSLSGILLFNPVFDFKMKIVRQISYLCVDTCRKKAEELEERLLRIVDRISLKQIAMSI